MAVGNVKKRFGSVHSIFDVQSDGKTCRRMDRHADTQESTNVDNSFHFVKVKGKEGNLRGHLVLGWGELSDKSY